MYQPEYPTNHRPYAPLEYITLEPVICEPIYTIAQPFSQPEHAIQTYYQPEYTTIQQTYTQPEYNYYPIYNAPTEGLKNVALNKIQHDYKDSYPTYKEIPDNSYSPFSHVPVTSSVSDWPKIYPKYNSNNNTPNSTLNNNFPIVSLIEPQIDFDINNIKVSENIKQDPILSKYLKKMHSPSLAQPLGQPIQESPLNNAKFEIPNLRSTSPISSNKSSFADSNKKKTPIAYNLRSNSPISNNKSSFVGSNKKKTPIAPNPSDLEFLNSTSNYIEKLLHSKGKNPKPFSVSGVSPFSSISILLVNYMFFK